MRRQLIVGAAAVTATVVIAFVVPLGLAVRALAANGPLSAAEQTATSLAAVAALTDDERVIGDALAAAQARSEAALTVHLADGRTLGAAVPAGAAVDRAFEGVAFGVDAADARHVLVPAVRAGGTVAVVQAVLAGDVLRRGVVRSWVILLGLALALLAVAVAIADWLGRSVVGPTRELAVTARRVADGDLAARVIPAGPPEIADVGGALNGLAARISDLLAAERELVADLSHRLRTPLTALRLDADAVADPEDRDRLQRDVEALEATVTELIREAREPSTVPADAAVDLVPLVRDRAAHWGALAEEQQRRWELTVETGTAPIRLPASEAQALLDVLLDNVFTHTPDGTPYWIRLEPDRLVIEDAGGGPASAVASARGGSAAGSTGLGFDIARQAAQRAGGELRIGPRSPTGTCVEVLLERHGEPRPVRPTRA